MERVLCPRVHFKIIIFDLKTAYVGSANLTGAGLGMKGENTRNFEAGVLSRNKDFVKTLSNCSAASGYACAQAQTSITSSHVNERSSYGSPLQGMQAEGVLWGSDWMIIFLLVILQKVCKTS